MYYVFTKNLLGAHFCKKYCFLVVLVVVVVEVSSKYNNNLFNASISLTYV
jgi:hypothetical protein